MNRVKTMTMAATEKKIHIAENSVSHFVFVHNNIFSISTNFMACLSATHICPIGIYERNRRTIFYVYPQCVHQLIDMFYYVTILRLLLIYTFFFFACCCFSFALISTFFYRIWCTVIRLILDAVIFLYNRFDGMFYFSFIFSFFSPFFIRCDEDSVCMFVIMVVVVAVSSMFLPPWRTSIFMSVDRVCHSEIAFDTLASETSVAKRNSCLNWFFFLSISLRLSIAVAVASSHIFYTYTVHIRCYGWAYNIFRHLSRLYSVKAITVYTHNFCRTNLFDFSLLLLFFLAVCYLYLCLRQIYL